MQFEAKNDGSGNAVSQPANTPWVLITHNDAKSECMNIGGNYDLISNAEWMAIALEIELNQNNWSSGIVGTGMIYGGGSRWSLEKAIQQ